MGFKELGDYGVTLHKPVMVKEVLQFLLSDRNGIYLDATTGTGGHSLKILEALQEGGRLISLDRDKRAIEIARARCDDSRQTVLRISFSRLGEALDRINVNTLDGALFDLGVSMMQLKDMQRGFSFDSPERLDMRMDTEQELDAYRVVNEYPEKALEEIIRLYGEEHNSKRITRAIVHKRAKGPITSCIELANIVSTAVGYRGRVHPATKTFQAIRIEVNNEVSELRSGIKEAMKRLKKGGRLCVVSYHSIEDREVKNLFKDAAILGIISIVTKKPLRPSFDEVKENRASRGARLRVCERL